MKMKIRDLMLKQRIWRGFFIWRQELLHSCASGLHLQACLVLGGSYIKYDSLESILSYISVVIPDHMASYQTVLEAAERIKGAATVTPVLTCSSLDK
jgi:hypothetical protein